MRQQALLFTSLMFLYFTSPFVFLSPPPPSSSSSFPPPPPPPPFPTPLCNIFVFLLLLIPTHFRPSLLPLSASFFSSYSPSFLSSSSPSSFSTTPPLGPVASSLIHNQFYDAQWSLPLIKKIISAKELCE